MTRRGAVLRQRSPLNWGARLVIAVMAMAVGFFTITRSVAFSIRESSPARAFALAPEDGRIAGSYAALLSGPEATLADRRMADAVAVRALRSDPTAIGAVSTLGLNAQVRGDTARARRLFAYASTLTRRDQQTQLWAIEDSVGRGDVAAALRHYDIALRTSPRAADLLFPVLAGATADPAIRTALIKTLQSKPAWGDAFIDFVAGKGPDPLSIANLFIGLAHAGVGISENARRATIDGLIESGHLNYAWEYYRRLHPGSSRTQSRDAQFTTNLSSPSLLDWRPVNDGGLTTAIERSGNHGIFDFSVASSVGGPLLEQMQMLPAGRYRLEGRSNGIATNETMRPYWTLMCRSDNHELGRIFLPSSDGDSKNFTGMFDVPDHCETQMLRLVAQPSDAVAGVSGRIEKAYLRPAAAVSRNRP